MSNILYIGHFYRGSTENSRLIDLKEHYDVDIYDLSKHFPIWKRSFSSLFKKINAGPPYFFIFKDLKNKIKNRTYQLIFIEKNLYLSSKRIKTLFKNKEKIIMFCHDNILYDFNYSPLLKESIHLFDGIITTKKNNVKFFEQNGCKNVFHINNASSYVLSKNFLKKKENTKSTFEYDIGFIGRWEKEREDLFFKLSKNSDYQYILAGPGWMKTKKVFPDNVTIKNGFWGDDYYNVISKIKINLALTSKKVKDTQTTRTVELSTYDGFILYEKTEDTDNIFGQELNDSAFSSLVDLEKKIELFLSNDKLRIDQKNMQLEAINSKKLFWYFILPNILNKFL